MTASSLCFRAAVLFLVAGIALGLAMAATQDHLLMPVHAHVNLLGWVSLFLIGLYDRLHPALDRSRAARLQAGLWILGTLAMTLGLAALLLGRAAALPFVFGGAILLLLDALFLAVLVIAASRSRHVALAAVAAGTRPASPGAPL